MSCARSGNQFLKENKRAMLQVKDRREVGGKNSNTGSRTSSARPQYPPTTTWPIQKLPIFQIVKQNETDNKILRAYHCPAFIETDNGLAIDPATCTGCSVCKQLAPNSVEIMKEGENAK